MTDYLTMPYADFVAALVKDGDQIKSEMTGPQAHLLHMAIGVAGECSEAMEACIASNATDDENLIEELGDLEFFLQGIRTEIGVMREQTLPEDFVVNSGPAMPIVSFATLCVGGGKVLDAVKKFVIYQKPLEVADLLDGMREVETAMAWIRNGSGIDREDVLVANRVKLGEKRYKGMKFTNEAAQARADKA